MKDLNINFELAQNGQIAIDKCKEEEFDIILMDINMPILNGIEATYILKNEYKLKTPIIALTANIIIKRKINKIDFLGGIIFYHHY